MFSKKDFGVYKLISQSLVLNIKFTVLFILSAHTVRSAHIVGPQKKNKKEADGEKEVK